MLTITLAARMNVIEIAFASAVGATLCMRRKRRRKRKMIVLSIMYLYADAEFETLRKYSIRRRSFNYLWMRLLIVFLARTSGNVLVLSVTFFSCRSSRWISRVCAQVQKYKNATKYNLSYKSYWITVICHTSKAPLQWNVFSNTYVICQLLVKESKKSNNKERKNQRGETCRGI